MDRFAWTDGLLASDEQLVTQQNGIKLYDGDDKTSFEHGKMDLTTNRIIWKHHKDQNCNISLHLSLVIFIEEQAASGWHKSNKVILHLAAPADYKPPGPCSQSKHSHVNLGFKDGGQQEFLRNLNETWSARRWELPAAPIVPSTTGVRKPRAGIVGIEKSLRQKHQETDKGISDAFQDLSQLMDKAKEMVTLAKKVSSKIKDKQGDITEDETVRFKSYLLSLGIPDPVTRETHGSGNKYYRELAREISSALDKPLQECGGIMTVTDVYCRINRARGMELLSPDDLINACKLMEELRLPVRLRVFESGVMVLQLQSHSEEKIIAQTQKMVDEHQSLTADELARYIGLSVILSKERLLLAEQSGHLCRDETVEGLRFYPNRFLLESA